MGLLFLIILIVETFFDHLAGLQLLVDAHLYGSVQLRMVDVEQSHANALSRRYAVVARGYFANDFVVGYNLVAMTRNGASSSSMPTILRVMPSAF